ncbi:MAG: leucyl/phenylalanyl-tRNA--protein transferase [Xanthomonadaceae bacterium]|nr:leucyl/phenylalanyl-tRNA--protein transferase [Xanthomonadaceae bacterium]
MSDLPEKVIPWFCPKKRAILEFKNLHLSTSTKKLLKKNPFTVTRNKDFRAVITECSSMTRKDQPGTWITSALLEAYCALHELGYAHSMEVWKGKKLVGGVYGVEIDGVVSAESMFHTESNASKIALITWIQELEKLGCKWIDIQALTPHTKSIGGTEITRNSFLNRLHSARESGVSFWSKRSEPSHPSS